MKSTWSLLALLAATALVQASVAGALAVPAGSGHAAGTSQFEDPSQDNIEIEPPKPVAAATKTNEETWPLLQQWFGEGYDRAPALILGLAVLLAIPPLALAGFLLRKHKRPSPDATIALTRSSRRPVAFDNVGATRTEGLSWPTEAWVDIEGTPGGRFIIDRSLVRIGREADNDIRLSNKTVHRYHAAIRRTPEGDVLITDLSSADGNGVVVNGARVGEARLKKGDQIHIGEARLRFGTQKV